MPNWCMNNVVLRHDDLDVVKETIAKLEAMEENKLFHTLDPEWEFREAIDVDWGNDSDQTEIHLNFSSAWSAPEDLYNTLEESGWTVWATYYEPGMEIAGITSDYGLREFDDIHSITEEDIEADPDLKEVVDHWGILDEIEMLREMEEDEDEEEIDVHE